MNFEEFQIYFWAYVGENIISPLDRNIESRDFCDAVCFDAFRVYEQSNVNIDTICKLSENILFNVYRFKPILGN